jgi:hypothetical protein
LCGLCYVGKPLITGQYVPAIGTLVKNIDETSTGHKILKHYSKRLGDFVTFGALPPEVLADQDKEKTDAFLMTNLFIGLIVLTGFFASAALFVINSGQQATISKPKLVLTVAMVILAGTVIRLILAVAIYGNIDTQTHELFVSIADKGGNIYVESPGYNLTPVRLWVLCALKQIQLALPGAPFHFVVRSFFSGIDLLTLGVLLLIAGVRKLPAVRTAIFFYLCPITFLITGYHGQFENFAMLMVLTGIYMYLRFATKPILRTALLWLFATAGMIVKHNVFYEVIICLHSSIKRYRIKVPLFVISVIIFLSTFIPYWEEGGKGIINNVFKYGSQVGIYGITSLVMLPNLKNLFIPAMCVFPFFLKSKDIVAQCLLGVLFFLTFTTGIGIQYFVLPVALGALRPSKFFLLYILLASFYILGSRDNVFIPYFHVFQWNVVWVGVICWFIAEMRLDRQTARSALSEKTGSDEVLSVKRTADSQNSREEPGLF